MQLVFFFIQRALQNDDITIPNNYSFILQLCYLGCDEKIGDKILQPKFWVLKQTRKFGNNFLNTNFLLDFNHNGDYTYFVACTRFTGK